VRPAVVGLLAAACLAGTVTAASARLAGPLPPLRTTVRVPAGLVVPGGPAPAVPLPPGGGLEVDAESAGGAPAPVAALDPDGVRPIGSVAKTMTAIAVLDAHPLAPGEEGPVVSMTAQDVALFHEAVSADGSALPVRAGEPLTERQLLLGLMLPSANNLAETLARWVSGDPLAFVRRLNEMAERFGMRHTHFEDPSGYSPLTVSTPADLVRLGRAALAVPALAAVVATPEAPFPDGSTLDNLDALLLTVPGWRGIKTGETPSAGGCLLFAAERELEGGGGPVRVVGAVLGQPHLVDALRSARSAVEATYAGFEAVRLAAVTPALGGEVDAGWGEVSGLGLGAGVGEAVAVRRGSRVELVTVPAPTVSRVRQGDTVATVEARLGTTVVARWPVLATASLDPPLLWRLLPR
jgi:serine-type D-Ala-D-Ala carboxypeptidase (penicillin-binding protein 5/6)